MDPTNVPPKIYQFKPNCKKCLQNVKALLSKLQPGVYTIEVEGEGEVGKLTIKSRHNHTCGMLPTQNVKEDHINHEAVVATEGSSTSQQGVFKGFERADLQELAKTNKLKRLEFVQNLKMTFTDQEDGSGSDQNICDNNNYKEVTIPSQPKKDDDQLGTNGNSLLVHESKESSTDHICKCGGTTYNNGNYHPPSKINEVAVERRHDTTTTTTVPKHNCGIL